MPTISRGRALAYVVVLLVLLVLGGRVALGREPTQRRPPAREAVLQAEASAPRLLVVHVVGAVRRPGLYRLPEGSRVDDAVTRAGGPKPKAELALVNLAAPVADGQQVIVPTRGQAAAAPAPAGAESRGLASATVHLNSATLEQLDTLPGVGPVTAQKILDYRTANGAFHSVDELDAVSGIGPARLAEIRPLVDL
jgi:competence protein ComEA